MIYRKLIVILVGLPLVLVAGAVGYSAIEGWPFLDALYMTVITLASVGFMEVHPLSSVGRIFTIALIFIGSGMVIYGISVITTLVVEGEITDILRRRKVNRNIENLRGHYIICGAGNTGRYVIDELTKTGQDFVVIENDPDRASRLLKSGTLCIEGDATQDAVLNSAGIARASGLVAVIHTDAENLFLVITARRLNPQLRVIAKAVAEESEQKIRLAGADSVVLPNYIGGLRIASELIRPSVVSFLDIMLREKDKTIRVENIDIGPGSRYVGKLLAETGLRDHEDVSVVAVHNRLTGDYRFNPPRDMILTDDVVLIVMGEIAAIKSFRDAVA